MVNIILDTNIIIYFIQGKPEGKLLANLLKQHQIKFGISTITEMELYAKPDLNEPEKILIEECLTNFNIIDVNSTIARIAAYYRKNFNIHHGDNIIVATAKYFDVPLWTYNTKDFAKLSDVIVTPPTLPQL
jgi:predicted nucleic acid-binding protein